MCLSGWYAHLKKKNRVPFKRSKGSSVCCSFESFAFYCMHKQVPSRKIEPLTIQGTHENPFFQDCRGGKYTFFGINRYEKCMTVFFFNSIVICVIIQETGSEVQNVPQTTQLLFLSNIMSQQTKLLRRAGIKWFVVWNNLWLGGLGCTVAKQCIS